MRRDKLFLIIVVMMLVGGLTLPATPVQAAAAKITAPTHPEAMDRNPSQVVGDEAPAREAGSWYRELLEWILQLLPERPEPETPRPEKPEAAPSVDPLGWSPDGN